MVEHLKSKSEFEQYISKHPKVVVDFWAEWCGPCRVLGPIFEAASEELSDVKFVKVNVDEARDIAADFYIQAIPTMIVFEDGKEARRVSGTQTKDALIDWIQFG